MGFIVTVLVGLMNFKPRLQNMALFRRDLECAGQETRCASVHLISGLHLISGVHLQCSIDFLE